MSKVVKITLQVEDKKSSGYVLSDTLINALASSSLFISTTVDAKTGEQFRIIDKLFLPLGIEKADIDSWISQNNS